MPESLVVNPEKKRRSRLPPGTVGGRLVMSELVRRGFDVELADYHTIKYDLLVKFDALPPKPVHVRSVHVSPWYLRRTNFTGAIATQVTVYVLLGNEKENSSRFFLTRSSELVRQFRQPTNWNRFGLIDLESLEKYEDNWDILKV